MFLRVPVRDGNLEIFHEPVAVRAWTPAQQPVSHPNKPRAGLPGTPAGRPALREDGARGWNPALREGAARRAGIMNGDPQELAIAIVERANHRKKREGIRA